MFYLTEVLSSVGLNCCLFCLFYAVVSTSSHTLVPSLLLWGKMNDENTNDMALLQDRSVSGNIWDVAFCPNMDLIAVVIDRNAVSIFRTNWERLATISVCPQKDILLTCIAWSPDGANIVIGTSDQMLAVYSVDRCVSTSRTRTKRGSRDSEPVTQVKLDAIATSAFWCDTPDKEASGKRSSKNIYGDRAEYLQLEKTAQNEEQWNGMLLIGDDNGRLSILSHRLKLMFVSLQVMEPDQAICHINLTSSLQNCVLSGLNNSARDKGIKSGLTGDDVVIKALNISTVLNYWSEIDRIGVEVLGLDLLKRKLSLLIKKVKETWIEGALEVLNGSIRNPLEELMRKLAESPPNAWQALNNIYCGARIAGSSLEFLGNVLSENGAKDALRSFRDHADDIKAAAISCLPVAEAAVFRASEYRGLSRRSVRFAPVGLKFEDAETLYTASEEVYLVLQDLSCTLDGVLNETETFLAWLTIVAGKVSGESSQPTNPKAKAMVEKNAKLISQHFERWSPSSETAARDTVASIIQDQVEPALSRFEAAVKQVAGNPTGVISKGLLVQGGISVPIHSPPRPYSRICSSFCDWNDSKEVETMYITISQNDGSFVNVKHKFSSERWSVKKYNPQVSDLCLQHVIHLSSDILIIATGDSENRGADGKFAGQIALFQCGNLGGSDGSEVVHSSQNVTSVNILDSFGLEGQCSKSQDVSVAKSFHGMSLCANLSRGFVW